MEFNTMVEVLLVGAQLEDVLEEDVVVFATEGITSYAVQVVEEDIMENHGDVVYSMEGIRGGFARCGTVTLDGELVIAYKVDNYDTNNKEFDNKLYILDKLEDDSLEEE